MLNILCALVHCFFEQPGHLISCKQNIHNFRYAYSAPQQFGEMLKVHQLVLSLKSCLSIAFKVVSTLLIKSKHQYLENEGMDHEKLLILIIQPLTMKTTNNQYCRTVPKCCFSFGQVKVEQLFCDCGLCLYVLLHYMSSLVPMYFIVWSFFKCKFKTCTFTFCCFCLMEVISSFPCILLLSSWCIASCLRFGSFAA